MKKARISTKNYVKVVSSDNMPSQRDVKIQVYNGKRTAFVFTDPKSKVVQLLTV